MIRRSIRLSPERGRDVLWGVSFLAVLGILLVKCRFGFANIDESFYLTIPLRLCQGDGLFVHEWHLSQMSSVLLYPLVRLYLLLAPDTQGMLLAFRYIFTLLHSAGAAFIYLRLRKTHPGAAFASLIHQIFVPFGIMALSYNSMGLSLLALCGVLLITRKGLVDGFAAGLLFASAVLCCPYLAAVYLLYGAGFALLLAHRASRSALPADAPRMLLFFTLGCAVACAAFLAFVFSRCAPGELMAAIPHILSDPEHPPRAAGQILSEAFSGLLAINARTVPVFASTLALLMYIIIRRLWGKALPAGEKALCFACGLLLCACYLRPFLTQWRHINFRMLPLGLMGLVCFALHPRQTMREMLFLFLPGMLYGLCLTLSSNNGHYVIANAALLSSMAGALMMTSFPARAFCQPWARRLCALVVCGFLAFFSATLLQERYATLFWENGGMAEMTQEISFGVEKGLRTTPSNAERYARMYSASQPVRDQAGQRVLYLGDYTWYYLDDPRPIGAYSAWLSGTGAPTMERLSAYYALNPDKLPNVVYVVMDRDLSPLRDDFASYARIDLDIGYMLVAPQR